MARGARDGRKAAQSTVHPHLSVTRAGGRSLPSLELSRQHINSGARSGLVTCVLATTATRASPVVASKNKRKEINRIPAFPLYTSLSLSPTHTFLLSLLGSPLRSRQAFFLFFSLLGLPFGLGEHSLLFFFGILGLPPWSRRSLFSTLFSILGLPSWSR